MSKRPVVITVIAWFLIVTGVLSVFGYLMTLDNPAAREVMSKNPLPMPVQYALMWIGTAVSIASGIGMLKGKAWGRLLYVVWGIIGFLVGLVASPVKVAMVPGLVIFAVIVFFLFRPNSNKYFMRA
ncbi:MAG: hypothetical protein GF375_02050 [Candidatus Omnitrophica bacterium]|nr:hypothetical protein [Candidatus Omnitrophota bacterium]MBD3268897.1 hypothetical protein [Candidatus Omnitrophota bacterium]